MAEWTAEQTMHYLGISRATLYSLVKRGRLVKRRHAVGRGVGGRRTYFASEEVKALKGKAPVQDDRADQVERAQIEQVLTTQLQVVRTAEQRGSLSAPSAYSVRQTLWAIGTALGVKLLTGDEAPPPARRTRGGQARHPR